MVFIDYDIYISNRSNVTLKDLARNNEELELVKSVFTEDFKLHTAPMKYVMVSIDGFWADTVAGTENLFKDATGMGYNWTWI